MQKTNIHIGNMFPVFFAHIPNPKNPMNEKRSSVNAIFEIMDAETSQWRLLENGVGMFERRQHRGQPRQL